MDHEPCQRQPGAPGFAPQPPAVEFTGRPDADLLTTVPSSVLPCAVHWQYPPMGMVVTQVNLPASQMFAADAAPPPSAAAARTAQLKYPVNRIPGTFHR
jgi:hypothetical protein